MEKLSRPPLREQRRRGDSRGYRDSVSPLPFPLSLVISFTCRPRAAANKRVCRIVASYLQSSSAALRKNRLFRLPNPVQSAKKYY